MSEALPPGYSLVNVRTTHLEMLLNEVPEAPDPPAPWRIERWATPRLDEYRALFAAVGGDWGWTGRLLLSDEELALLLADDRIEIWRLVSDAGPDADSYAGPGAGRQVAGFIELDRTVPGEVEIVYFGLVQEFIGRGLGRLLLDWAINHAWTSAAAGLSEPTKRLWLHTCDFDSPTAPAFYKKAGFQVFLETEGPEVYPEALAARHESAAAG